MTSVTVTAPNGGTAPTNVETGKTISLGAQATWSDEHTSMTEADAWTSKDKGIATVDAKGVVTGVAAGTARINATINGITSPTCRSPSARRQARDVPARAVFLPFAARAPPIRKEEPERKPS